MSDGVLTVGRPKKPRVSEPPPPPAPEPAKWEAKRLIFQMRGSDEFKAWLLALADFDATDATEVVERALAAYARTIGFTQPRPKR